MGIAALARQNERVRHRIDLLRVKNPGRVICPRDTKHFSCVGPFNSLHSLKLALLLVVNHRC
eukprot:scaffold97978_cov100-Phaeocystis_antarctica.AAC.1